MSVRSCQNAVKIDHAPLLADEKIEPTPGLPARLPEGETMLWQGRPDPIGLAVHAFHIRFIALYFVTTAVMKALPMADAAAAARAAGPTLLAGAGGIAILCIIAWAMAGSAMFTVTNKRIVFRAGAAIPKYVNLPFKEITRIDLRSRVRTGDIAITLSDAQRAPFLHLWPFARPLQLARPVPLMRALPKADAEAAAKALAEAIKAAAPNGVALASETRAGAQKTGRAAAAQTGALAQPAHP